LPAPRSPSLAGRLRGWGKNRGVNHSPGCLLQTEVLKIGGESVQVIAGDLRQFPDDG